MEPDSVRVPRTTWNDKQLEVYAYLWTCQFNTFGAVIDHE